MTAIGIHAHPTRKLGRRPPKNALALLFASFWTGSTLAHPITADFIDDVVFGLDGNDEYGDCGPTSCDNLCRATSAAALGGESIAWTQDEVFALYKLNNPTFDPNAKPDPATGEVPGDNGVDMQTMLEFWHQHGAGHDENGQPIKPIAFAKVDVTNDAELNAAAALGGLLWGVSLETAQQTQTDARPPKWDYQKSSPWGGHAIYEGEYDEQTQLDHVISWQIDVQVTKPFRGKQLEEAWLVILPWHVAHPKFFNVVDASALASAYQSVTGKTLVVPPSPAPSPSPSPPVPAPSNADQALWDAIKKWVNGRHSSATKAVAADIAAWATEKGLS